MATYHLQQEYEEKHSSELGESDQNTHILTDDMSKGGFPEEAPSFLHCVANDIMNESPSLQFMDAINVGNSAMGNRAFLQFVGGLYRQRQHTNTHGIVAKGVQDPGKPMTHLSAIQQAFGHHDVSSMREHTGPGAKTSLESLGAKGFSSNGHMAFAGIPDLYTQAHEAAHGVQQTGLGDGLQLKGGIGEAGDRYERHADTVAEKVVQGESAEALLDAEAGGPTKVSAGPVSGSEPVQMMRLVYVGAGPRSTSHIRAEIDFIAERIKDFESLANAGANYNIRSTVIDQAPRSNFGRGYAWNNRQGVGNVNSGGEASSYEQLAAKYKEVTQNEEGMQRSLYENPVGHSNIELGVRSTAIMADPEHPYMERSVLSRQHQGEQEAQHFDERVEYARKNLSKYYTVELIPDTTVTGVDISSDPKRPVAEIGPGDPVTSDMMRLVTGTIPQEPVRNKDVLNRTYCDWMNQDDLHEFFNQLGLIGGNGKLRPGVKLLVGGSGLSTLDELIALSGEKVMDLVEPVLDSSGEKMDPESITGYQVKERARSDYRGAIRIVSFRKLKLIEPRHSTSPEWESETEPLGNTEELHALFLHNQGEQVFEDWMTIMIASIARALNTVPDDVINKVIKTATGYEKLETTEQLAAKHYQETEQYGEVFRQAEMATDPRERKRLFYETGLTRPGIMRSAILSALIGSGMSSDIGATLAEMNKKAPFTYKGRAGTYQYLRGEPSALTQSGSELTKGGKNRVYLGRLEEYKQYLTASPYRVQSLFHKLFESEIATYQEGDYNDIMASPDGTKLILGGEEFDAFVVSPTFGRNLDPVIKSLNNQVMPIPESQGLEAGHGVAHLPKIAHHRLVYTKGGALSHLEDQSLNTQGIKNPHGGSTVAMRAFDVNNRDSAYEDAPMLAVRRFAIEHLAAAGIEDPVGVVESLYDALLPTEEQYQSEVEQFLYPYYEAKEKAAYLETVQDMYSRNPNLYMQYTQPEYVKSSEFRRFYGGQAYDKRKKLIPEYQPASREDYVERFIDSPMHIHEMVYKQALVIARKHLWDRALSKRVLTAQHAYRSTQ